MEEKKVFHDLYRRHPGGRPRKIETPELLKKAFEDYRSDAQNHPICKKKHIYGTVGDTELDKYEVEEIPAPITKSGFCLWLGVNESYLRDLPEEFSSVVTYIGDECFRVNVDGAKAGIYKENLVAREFGLAEKAEINANVKGEWKNVPDVEAAKKFMLEKNRQ